MHQSRPVQSPDQHRSVVVEDIRTSWEEFLGALAANARILDASLGNHVPALIAAELARAKGQEWTVHAIHPPESDSRGAALEQRIVFTQATTPGRLPYADASFDAVCGHHLLDNVDPASALAELRRVLAPGSDAQFMLHHAQSAVAGVSRVSMEEGDLVFVQTKAFRRVHQLLTMQHAPAASITHAETEVRQVIRTLKAAQPDAAARGGGRVLTVALDAIRKLLIARQELAPALVGLAVDRAENELRQSLRTVSTVAASARSDHDMHTLAAQSESLGFTQAELMARTDQDGQPMHWQLLLHRP